MPFNHFGFSIPQLHDKQDEAPNPEISFVSVYQRHDLSPELARRNRISTYSELCTPTIQPSMLEVAWRTERANGRTDGWDRRRRSRDMPEGMAMTIFVRRRASSDKIRNQRNWIDVTARWKNWLAAGCPVAWPYFGDPDPGTLCTLVHANGTMLGEYRGREEGKHVIRLAPVFSGELNELDGARHRLPVHNVRIGSVNQAEREAWLESLHAYREKVSAAKRRAEAAEERRRRLESYRNGYLSPPKSAPAEAAVESPPADPVVAGDDTGDVEALQELGLGNYAPKLVAHGFSSREKILEASSDELRKIPGFGRVTVERIRKILEV